MKKRYYIAEIKQVRFNDSKFEVLERVSLNMLSTYYDTLAEAEQDLINKGSKFTSYTIIGEYYNSN